MAESKDSSSFLNLRSENFFPLRILMLFFEAVQEIRQGRKEKIGDSAVGASRLEGRFLLKVRELSPWGGRALRWRGQPCSDSLA